jgi:hypothetical protein
MVIHAKNTYIQAIYYSHAHNVNHCKYVFSIIRRKIKIKIHLDSI